MPLAAPRLLSRWNLVFVAGALIAVMALVMSAWPGLGVEGVRMAIRATARTSFGLFCAAFVAGPVHALWPNAFTRWQRANRRYLGLSFAASHLIHALVIAVFATLDHVQFAAGRSFASYLIGGVGYGFVLAMAATSFDRTAAWLGPRAWQRLHRIGGYYLCLNFALSFAKRAVLDPRYLVFELVLVLVIAVRIAAACPNAQRAVVA